jgi:hypothetical protein
MPLDASLTALLESDSERRTREWDRVVRWLSKRFGPIDSVEAALFIIGLQERGRGFEPQLSREEKQEVIMEGMYVALAELDVFELQSDDEGGQFWSPRLDMGFFSPDEQAVLLRIGIIRNLSRHIDSE